MDPDTSRPSSRPASACSTKAPSRFLASLPLHSPLRPHSQSTLSRRSLKLAWAVHHMAPMRTKAHRRSAGVNRLRPAPHGKDKKTCTLPFTLGLASVVTWLADHHRPTFSRSAAHAVATAAVALERPRARPRLSLGLHRRPGTASPQPEPHLRGPAHPSTW